MGGERTMAVKIRSKIEWVQGEAPFFSSRSCRFKIPKKRSRFIEEVGTYNPLTDPATVNIDAEAVKK